MILNYNQFKREYYYCKLRIYFLLMAVICTISCSKDDTVLPEISVTDAGAQGVYILNEGLMNMNNTTLTYYDFNSGTKNEDIFLQANNRHIGDTGNDMKRYGSKLYIVVNVSERIEIIDGNTAKSLAQITLTGKQPRRIAFYKNKAYVSCYDGNVVRIDTATLAIDATIAAGANPEGLCVANGKLYVANSGGLNYPNYGNTVSVYDLNSFKYIKDIIVEMNPYAIMSDKYGDVYLVSRGNYGTIPYSFHRIDSQLDTVVQNMNIQVLNFTIYDDYAYLYSYNFNDKKSWIKVLNINTEKLVKEQFITDGTSIETPYCIQVNPSNQDVYIADAYQFTVNGDLYCFDKNGKKKFQVEVGLNPSSIVFK